MLIRTNLDERHVGVKQNSGSVGSKPFPLRKSFFARFNKRRGETGGKIDWGRGREGDLVKKTGRQGEGST
jgi:hypothetical protein